MTAISTTPAFHTFTRELGLLVGMRGRIGVGTERVLVYSTIRLQGPAPATNASILADPDPAGTELQRARRFEVQSARVSVNYRF